MKQNLGYCRVSKDNKKDGTQDGKSVELQLEDIAQYAAKNGILVDEYLVDIGGARHQARTKKRARFKELMRRVAKGEVGLVLIDDQERLGFRDPWEFGSYVHTMRTNGCKLVQVSDGAVLTDVDLPTLVTSTIGAYHSMAELTKKSYRSLEAMRDFAKESVLLGGPPPFGLDSVLVDEDGDERWRVVYETKCRRYRVWPGRPDDRERWDGPCNFPRDRLQGDRLTVRPTRLARRIEVVKEMYRMALTGLPTYMIARHFNDKRDAAVHHNEGMWTGAGVYKLLTNPIYRGVLSFNRTSRARYVELKDGEINMNIPDEFKMGADAALHRVRKPDEWINSSILFEPIVPEETWRRVYDILTLNKKSRGPRSEKYWLSGLVYCGKCGKKLFGCLSYRGAHKSLPCYSCPTYTTYGGGDTGCTPMRFPQSRILEAVDEYLRITSTNLKAVLDAGEAAFIAEIYRQAARDRSGLEDVRVRMEQYLVNALQQVHVPERTADGRWRFHVPNQDAGMVDLVLPSNGAKIDRGLMECVYSWASASERHKNREALAALEAKYDALAEQWIGFKDLPTARAKVHSKMKAMEAEMERLKATSVDLAAEVKGATAWLSKHLIRLYRVRKEIATSEESRRSLALREVFDRIVLHTKPYQHGPQVQHRVHAIEFVPTGGVSATVLVDKTAGPQLPVAADGVNSPLMARPPRP
ncbi:recombinase family protein [Paludisphaera mucosa]|uniref:Recombinase family protein n=1 Tax=Paludisphaera mucosa TaxID=3030827 RepID=A0ABT6FJ09_9BACT|nr:recombinase family protein [Paludisphaera mucosa]